MTPHPQAPSPLLAQTTVPSPLGPLLLACTHQGLAGVWFAGQKHHPGALQAPQRMHPMLLKTILQLDLYWRDAHHRFDLVLDPQGSDFQRAVWQRLILIQPGRTSSYGDIARDLGQPQAARAVGSAVGRNPLSIVVPCHRVLGANGALTGYAGGIERKQDLLRREGAAWRGLRAA